MIRSSKTFPGVSFLMRNIRFGSRPNPTRKSTSPLLPKVRIDFPVLASISSR